MLQTNFAKQLKGEVDWVLKNFGSDAEEKKNPGSKATAQARRIAEFADQYMMAREMINHSMPPDDFDLIRVVITRATHG